MDAVNENDPIVEEIRTSDLDATDEDFRHGVVLALGESYGDATAGTSHFDFGTEIEFAKVMDGEEAGNEVLSKERRNRAREARAERGIGGSEES